MVRRALFVGCLLVLALSACGDDSPVSRAPVTYVAPPTKGGRLCAEQCGKSRNYCSWGCDLDYRACYGDAQAVAEKDYDRYATSRLKQRLPVDKFPGDFQHTEACDAAKKQCAADCDRPYNACYSSCGGSVAAPESCFLCFE